MRRSETNSSRSCLGRRGARACASQARASVPPRHAAKKSDWGTHSGTNGGERHATLSRTLLTRAARAPVRAAAPPPKARAPRARKTRSRRSSPPRRRRRRTARWQPSAVAGLRCCRSKRRCSHRARHASACSAGGAPTASTPTPKAQFFGAREQARGAARRADASRAAAAHGKGREAETVVRCRSTRGGWRVRRARRGLLGRRPRRGGGGTGAGSPRRGGGAAGPGVAERAARAARGEASAKQGWVALRGARARGEEEERGPGRRGEEEEPGRAGRGLAERARRARDEAGRPGESPRAARNARARAREARGGTGAGSPSGAARARRGGAGTERAARARRFSGTSGARARRVNARWTIERATLDS